MSLLLTNAFEDIKRRYLEVIEQTPGMAEYTRWKYGQHPSDEMLQGVYQSWRDVCIYGRGNGERHGSDYHVSGRGL